VFATGVVLPHAAEANFWEERRHAQQPRPAAVADAHPTSSTSSNLLLAQLGPVARPNPLTLSALPTGASLTRRAALPPNITAAIAAVRLQGGRVTEIHQGGPTSPLVLHLQDIHGLTEAQVNGASMIEALARQQPGLMVGVEGAAGPFFIDSLRRYPRADIRKSIARHFLERDYIGSAEYVALSSDQPPFLWGIENRTAYERHVQAFKDSVPAQVELDRRLKEWRPALAAAERKFFSTELQALEAAIRRFGRNELDLAGYLQTLGRLTPATAHYPSARLALEALTLEKKLDFPRVEAERRAVVEAVAAKLPQSDLEELAAVLTRYREGELSTAAYYGELKTRMGSVVNAARFPLFFAYMDYLLLAERIRGEALFEETARMEREAEDALALTPAARRLVAARRTVDHLEKLSRHEMTPRDWDFYVRERRPGAALAAEIQALAAEAGSPLPTADGASFERTLAPFEQFYELAINRNEHLVDGLQGQMKERHASVAVLVAGGFHTDGVKAELRKRGFSYLVLTPNVTNIQMEGDYLQGFVRAPVPLERLFAGERIFLSQPRPLANPDTLAAGVVIGEFGALNPAADVAERSLTPGAATNVAEIETRLQLYAQRLDGLPGVTNAKVTLQEAGDGTYVILRLTYQKNGKEITADLLATRAALTDGARQRLAREHLGGRAATESATLSTSVGDVRVDIVPGATGVGQSVLSALRARLAALRPASRAQAAAAVPVAADILEPIPFLRRFQNGPWWQRAIYYLLVSLWEESAFRLPILLLPLGASVGAIAGVLLWGVVGFIAAHLIVRWLVNRGTPNWDGWTVEILKEVGLTSATVSVSNIARSQTGGATIFTGILLALLHLGAASAPIFVALVVAHFLFDMFLRQRVISKAETDAMARKFLEFANASKPQADFLKAILEQMPNPVTFDLGSLTNETEKSLATFYGKGLMPSSVLENSSLFGLNDKWGESVLSEIQATLSPLNKWDVNSAKYNPILTINSQLMSFSRGMVRYLRAIGHAGRIGGIILYELLFRTLPIVLAVIYSGKSAGSVLMFFVAGAVVVPLIMRVVLRRLGAYTQPWRGLGGEFKALFGMDEFYRPGYYDKLFSRSLVFRTVMSAATMFLTLTQAGHFWTTGLLVATLFAVAVHYMFSLIERADLHFERNADKADRLKDSLSETRETAGLAAFDAVVQTFVFRWLGLIFIPFLFASAGMAELGLGIGITWAVIVPTVLQVGWRFLVFDQTRGIRGVLALFKRADVWLTIGRNVFGGVLMWVMANNGIATPIVVMTALATQGLLSAASQRLLRFLAFRFPPAPVVATPTDTEASATSFATGLTAPSALPYTSQPTDAEARLARLTAGQKNAVQQTQEIIAQLTPGLPISFETRDNLDVRGRFISASVSESGGWITVEIPGPTRTRTVAINLSDVVSIAQGKGNRKGIDFPVVWVPGVAPSIFSTADLPELNWTVSPNGTLVAVSGDGMYIFAPRNDRRFVPKLPEGETLEDAVIGWSADGKVLILSRNNRLFELDEVTAVVTERPQPPMTDRRPPSSNDPTAWLGPNGEIVYSNLNNGDRRTEGATVLKPVNGGWEKTVLALGPIVGAVFAPDGSAFAVLRPGAIGCTLFQTGMSNPMSELRTAVEQIQFAKDNRHVLVFGHNKLAYIDGATDELEWLIQGDIKAAHVIDDRFAVVLLNNGKPSPVSRLEQSVMLVDLRTGQMTESGHFSNGTLVGSTKDMDGRLKIFAISESGDTGAWELVGHNERVKKGERAEEILGKELLSVDDIAELMAALRESGYSSGLFDRALEVLITSQNPALTGHLIAALGETVVLDSSTLFFLGIVQERIRLGVQNGVPKPDISALSRALLDLVNVTGAFDPSAASQVVHFAIQNGQFEVLGQALDKVADKTNRAVVELALLVAYRIPASVDFLPTYRILARFGNVVRRTAIGSLNDVVAINSEAVLDHVFGLLTDPRTFVAADAAYLEDILTNWFGEGAPVPGDVQRSAAERLLAYLETEFSRPGVAADFVFDFRLSLLAALAAGKTEFPPELHASYERVVGHVIELVTATHQQRQGFRKPTVYRNVAAVLNRSTDARQRGMDIIPFAISVSPPFAQMLNEDLQAGRLDGTFIAQSIIQYLERPVTDPNRANPEQKKNLYLALSRVQSPLVRSFLLRQFNTETLESVRKAVAIGLSGRFTNAFELLHAIYPNAEDRVKIDRLDALVKLTELTGDGLDQSVFMERGALDSMLATYEGLARVLAPPKLRDLIKTWRSLADVQILVLVGQRRSPYKLGELELDYPLPQTGTPPESTEPGVLSVKPGSEDPTEKGRIRTLFDRFVELIDANFAALEVMSRRSADLDADTARFILNQLGLMLDAYEKLNGPDAFEARQKFIYMRNELEDKLDDHPSGPLPQELREKFTLLGPSYSLNDVYTVHTFINYLHQRSFDPLMSAVGNAGALTELRFGNAQVSVLNLDDAPLIQGGRFASRALRTALRAFQRQTANRPTVKVIVRGNYLSIHSKLGAHSVEILVNLASPDEGGLIRVRYQEGGRDEGNQLRLTYLTEIFERLGFHVKLEGNQFMNAVMDKDHGADLPKMERGLWMMLRSLFYTSNLDWGLEAIFKYSRDLDAAKAVAREMARTYLAEGSLPFYESSSSSSDLRLRDRFTNYQGAAAISHRTSRDSLNAALGTMGLPPIPDDEPMGQTAVDEYWNSAIRRGVARGEIILDALGTPARRDAYSAMEPLLGEIGRQETETAQMASVIAGLDPARIDATPIGTVGQLMMTRSEIDLDDGRFLIVTQLVHPTTGRALFATAHLGNEQGVGGALTVTEVNELLVDAGWEMVAPVAITPQILANRRSLMRSKPVHRDLGRTVNGLGASAGNGTVMGRVTFDGKNTKGNIFVAPYTTPDDLEAIKASRAVVTTGGGILSHAGVTTREFGIPAVIVQNAQWITDNGKDALKLTISRPGPAQLNDDGLWISGSIETETVILRGGETLIVNGATGRVSVMSGPFGRLITALEALPATGARQEVLADWLRDHGADALAAAAVGVPADETKLHPEMQGLLDLLAFLLSQSLDGRRVGAFSPNDILGAISSAQNRLPIAVRNGLEAFKGAVIAGEIESFQALHGAARAAIAAGGNLEIAKTLTQMDEQLGRLERTAAQMENKSDILAFLADARGRVAALHVSVEHARDVVREQLRDIAERSNTLGESDLPEMRRLLAAAERAGLSDTDAHTLLRARVDVLNRIERGRIDGDGVEVPRVIPLGLLGENHAGVAGPKAAKLGEIIRAVRNAGGYVPSGMSITRSAFDAFIDGNGLRGEYNRIAGLMDDELRDTTGSREQKAAAIDGLSKEMRALIMRGALSGDTGLGREITNGMRAHGLAGKSMAVRSSAIQEDTADAAFAGAAETFLNVSEAELLEHVKETWASFWLPRGIVYRSERLDAGFSQKQFKAAVLVQEMVDAEAAGVAFSVNPVNGRQEVVVNASYGLGEAVVSGLVDADQYIAGKSDGALIEEPVLGTKRVKIVRGEDGRSKKTAVSEADRRRYALTPEQVAEVARMAAALETYFGYPIDMEFAILDGKVAVLQARPVTTGSAWSGAANELRQADGGFADWANFFLASALKARTTDTRADGVVRAAAPHARRYLVGQALEASVKRLYRIARRIEGDQNAGARMGQYDPTTGAVDNGELYRDEAGTLQYVSNHPAFQDNAWLRETLATVSESEASARKFLSTPANLLRFYRELTSPEISRIYLRGARNNAPWIEIAEAIIAVETASDETLWAAMEDLTNKVHNTGAQFLQYAPDGKQIIDFRNLTRTGAPGADVDFAARQATPAVRRLFREVATQAAQNKTAAATSGTADLLEPLMRRLGLDRFINRNIFTQALYYLGVGIWESSFFLLGPIVSGPVFFLLHPVLRWLANGNRNGLSLRALINEVRADFVDARAHFFRSRIFAIIVLNALFFGLGDFSGVGAWAAVIGVHFIWDLISARREGAEQRRALGLLAKGLLPEVGRASSLMPWQPAVRAAPVRGDAASRLSVQLLFDGNEELAGLIGGPLRSYVNRTVGDNAQRVLPYQTSAEFYAALDQLAADLDATITDVESADRAGRAVPADTVAAAGYQLGLLAAHLENRDPSGSGTTGVLVTALNRLLAARNRDLADRLPRFTDGYRLGFAAAQESRPTTLPAAIGDKQALLVLHIPSTLPAGQKSRLTRTFIARLAASRGRVEQVIVIGDAGAAEEVRRAAAGLTFNALADHDERVFNAADGTYLVDGVVSVLSDDARARVLSGNRALPIISPFAGQWRVSTANADAYRDVAVVLLQIMGDQLFAVPLNLIDRVRTERLIQTQA